MCYKNSNPISRVKEPHLTPGNVYTLYSLQIQTHLILRVHHFVLHQLLKIQLAPYLDHDFPVECFILFPR